MYPIIELMSDESRVNLAQWVMTYGTPKMQDYVRGMLIGSVS